MTPAVTRERVPGSRRVFGDEMEAANQRRPFRGGREFDAESASLTKTPVKRRTTPRSTPARLLDDVEIPESLLPPAP